MGAFFDELSESLADWVREQKIFFVATAPLSQAHHVNVSPKGHTTLHLVSSTSCWYLDLTGSGNETISHLYESGNSGRITLLFQAFTGPPRIVRLFGYGKVFEVGSPEFEQLLPVGDPRRLPGSRSIVWIDFHKVGTSCGYSVPYYDYKEDRPTLLNWASARLEDDASTDPIVKLRGMTEYWCTRNDKSMDGLPGTNMSIRPSSKGRSARTAGSRSWIGAIKSAGVTSEFSVGVSVGLIVATVSYVVMRGSMSSVLSLLNV